MHHSKKSFKATLNDAVRSALAKNPAAKSKRFVVRARPLGLRPGIDSAGFNKLADDLETEASMARRTPAGKGRTV
jgi:hypothetical protein